MDWVMVTWVWPDGIGQLKWILARDLARAIDLADRQSGRPELVSGTVNLLYGMIFKLTGIHEVGMRFAENAALSIPVYTAVSEKLYTIALLGMTNTRLMVYLYIGVLLNREALNANTLVGAIAATFARRGRCGNDVPLAMWTTDFCRAIFANR